MARVKHQRKPTVRPLACRAETQSDGSLRTASRQTAAAGGADGEA